MAAAAGLFAGRRRREGQRGQNFAQEKPTIRAIRAIRMIRVIRAIRVTMWSRTKTAKPERTQRDHTEVH